MQAKHGMFIAFEGLDQSGKKTLSSWLTAHLVERGISARRYAFPNYQGVIGQLIKRYLDSELALSAQTRHLLFSADRWQSHEEMIDLIRSGFSVIADRYSGSGIAYGIAHGLEQEWLEGLEKGLPEPDTTFLVDIPADASFARKPEQRDLYEARNDLLSRVREVYLLLAKTKGWIVLDGLGSQESLHIEVVRKLAGLDYFCGRLGF